jgi:hypothetical protein
MNVLLMDLDVTPRKRPFPNLSLMKLSSHHKAMGDEVCLNFPLKKADVTYASCVFTWNARARARVPEGAVVGGPGIDLKARLRPEVEHTMPDYGLYPGIDFSLGFTSRGCTRRCPWCIVPEKEGGITPWARIYEFWDRRHGKIRLLDNNLLASPNWKQTMEDLLAEELEVDFNQGLDIRLITAENASYLKQVKTHQLRFAFDDIRYENALREGIGLLLDAGIRSRKLFFYVLVGFGDDDTAVERMQILNSYNVDCYPMAYRSADGTEPTRKTVKVPAMFWHGPRRNINKFLRLVGRLPE